MKVRIAREKLMDGDSRTTVCCRMQPIMIKEVLAYVCYHTVPRSVKYPDGIFMLKDGKPVNFEDLNPLGQVHTDRFGWLQNYEVPNE